MRGLASWVPPGAWCAHSCLCGFTTWAGIALSLSAVGARVCIAVCDPASALRVGVRLRLCRQGLRCLSLVLVLGCIAVRVGVRIRPYGQGLCLSLVVLVLCALVYGYGLWAKACFSVVLALSALCAHWCSDTAHGQGLRLFLRGSGTQREWRSLVYGYSLWARIALFSPWSWCSARCSSSWSW